jgi:hypothetical protein
VHQANTKVTQTMKLSLADPCDARGAGGAAVARLSLADMREHRIATYQLLGVRTFLQRI